MTKIQKKMEENWKIANFIKTSLKIVKSKMLKSKMVKIKNSKNDLTFRKI